MFIQLLISVLSVPVTLFSLLCGMCAFLALGVLVALRLVLFCIRLFLMSCFWVLLAPYFFVKFVTTSALSSTNFY